MVNLHWGLFFLCGKYKKCVMVWALRLVFSDKMFVLEITKKQGGKMPNIINVREERNVLAFDGDVFDIVADSTNFYLKFELDEEWAQCSIITVVFDFDGVKCCVELDEERMCRIPSTNASKVLFCITTEPDENSRLSSTILSLNVEPSSSAFTEDEICYQQSHRNLIGLVESLKSGESIYAGRAKVADASLTQVSLTGDEDISGVKNFLNRPQIADAPVISASEIHNENLLFNGRFRINQRGSSTVNRQTTDLYCMDRWLLSNGDGKFVRAKKTLTCTDETNPIFLTQWVEDAKDQVLGLTLTLSAEIDSVKYSTTFTLPSTGTEEFNFNAYISEKGAFRAHYKALYKKLGVQLIVNPGNEIIIDKVKLEIGEVATKYIERSTGEELALCQRHFQVLTVDSVGRPFNENQLFFSVPTPATMRPVASTVTVKQMPTIYSMDGTSIVPESITIFVRKDNIYQFLAHCSETLDLNKMYMITGGYVVVDSEVF